LMQTLRLDQEAVAARVGLKRATVANHLRLLDLPEKVQEALARELITMGHARALLGFDSRESMLSLLERIVREELSVRAVERLVREASAARPARTRPGASAPPAWIGELQRRMEAQLGTKVSVLNGEGFKGRIVVEYYSRGELDRLCEKLAPRPTL